MSQSLPPLEPMPGFVNIKPGYIRNLDYATHYVIAVTKNPDGLTILFENEFTQRKMASILTSKNEVYELIAQLRRYAKRAFRE